MTEAAWRAKELEALKQDLTVLTSDVSELGNVRRDMEHLSEVDTLRSRIFELERQQEVDARKAEAAERTARQQQAEIGRLAAMAEAYAARCGELEQKVATAEAVAHEGQVLAQTVEAGQQRQQNVLLLEQTDTTRLRSRAESLERENQVLLDESIAAGKVAEGYVSELAIEKSKTAGLQMQIKALQGQVAALLRTKVDLQESLALTNERLERSSKPANEHEEDELKMRLNAAAVDCEEMHVQAFKLQERMASLEHLLETADKETKRQKAIAEDAKRQQVAQKQETEKLLETLAKNTKKLTESKQMMDQKQEQLQKVLEAQQTMREEAGRVSLERDALRQKVAALEESSVAATAVVETLSSEKEKCDILVKELQTKTTECTTELTSLRRQVKDLKEESARHLELRQAAESHAEVCKTEMISKQSEAKAVKAEMSNLQKEVSALTGHLSTAQKKVSDETALTEQAQSLRKEMVLLEAARRHAEEARDVAEAKASKVDILHSKVQALLLLCGQLDEHAAGVAAAGQEKVAVMADRLASHANELRELHELRAERDVLKSSEAEQIEVAKSAEAESGKAYLKAQELQTQLDLQTIDLQKLQQGCRELQEQVKKEAELHQGDRMSLEGRHAVEMDALRSSLRRATAEKTLLQEQMEALSDGTMSAATSNSLDRTREQLARSALAEGSTSAAVVQQLQTENGRLHAKLESLEKQQAHFLAGKEQTEAFEAKLVAVQAALDEERRQHISALSKLRQRGRTKVVTTQLKPDSDEWAGATEITELQGNIDRLKADVQRGQRIKLAMTSLRRPWEGRLQEAAAEAHLSLGSFVAEHMGSLDNSVAATVQPLSKPVGSQKELTKLLNLVAADIGEMQAASKSA